MKVSTLPWRVEPYTPERWFADGKADPAFRTKPQIALELVDQALAQDWPFRAVVADCLYGEHRGFTRGLTQRNVPYVVALKPSHAWRAPVEAIGAVWEVAAAGGWTDPEQPGAWQPVLRQYRDGHQETWWALEGVAGPFGPERGRRLVIATADPATLAGGGDLVPGHHPARGCGRSGRDRAPLWSAQLGGAAVQAGQDQPGLEPVSGACGPGHAPPLGAGAVCVRLLLVGRDPRPRPGGPARGRCGPARPRRSGQPVGCAGGKRRHRRLGTGRGRRAAGPWRCGGCGPGWHRRGSCGAAGGPGATSRPRPRSRPCSTGCTTATRSASMTPPEPCQQSTAR